MEILIQAAQLILSLSIIVTLHEMGHFLPARWFGIRVEKFFLFFDAWGKKLFSKKVGETEYGIGWLPLGGYVKIAGMIDESMDKEQMAKPPQPDEFRSKPTWQRLIVMVGGVVVNALMAFIIYIFLISAYGEHRLPMSSMEDGLWVTNPILEDIGFETGDRIVQINGGDINYFDELQNEVFYAQNATIVNNGSKRTIEVPKDLIGQLSDQKKRGGLFSPRMPFEIFSVPDTSINSALFSAGDRVVEVDGNPINYFDEVKDILDANKGQNVVVVVIRNGERVPFEATVSDAGLFQVKPKFFRLRDLRKEGVYAFETINHSFLSSIPAGWNKMVSKLKMYVRQFSLIFDFDTGAYKGIGGFGAIGGLFPPTLDWELFWEATALISIILAFMNILPIPALDGGHVVFLLWEMITGKAAPQRVLEVAQVIGFFLVIALVIYANGNDLVRWIGNF